MKNKFKILSVFMTLMFTVVFASACTYSDTSSEAGNNSGLSYIGNIEGIKATYKPDTFEVADFYSTFAKDIVETLSNVYGMGTFEYKGVNNYNTLTLDERVLYVDDMRNTIYLHTPGSEGSDNFYYSYKNEENIWNWSIDINGQTYGYVHDNNIAFAKTFFNGYQINPMSSVDVFDDIEDEGNFEAERQNFYNNFYVSKFEQPMQVAILEILLGKTPTNFTFNTVTGNVEPDASTMIDALKTDYQKFATYIGINEQDKLNITDYILDSVIGSQKFADVTNDNNFTRDDYKTVVTDIIFGDFLNEYYFSNELLGNFNDVSLGSIYDVFPTATIQDYAANNFFISSIEGSNFSHIEAGEYQSIVLMPSEDNYLNEIWFYVVSERVMNITIHYRYYNASSDTYFVSDKHTIQTAVESEFAEDKVNVVSLTFEDAEGNDTLYETSDFNNSIGDGVLQAPISKNMDFETSQYYNLADSENGFGSLAILNKDKFQEDNSSYFELVFDVEKDGNDLQDDYSFKVGMSSLWFASAEMINQYLLDNQ